MASTPEATIDWMSLIAFCVSPCPSAYWTSTTLGHFDASSRAAAVVTRRQLLPPNPSVKPRLISSGPHHDGTPPSSPGTVLSPPGTVVPADTGAPMALPSTAAQSRPPATMVVERVDRERWVLMWLCFLLCGGSGYWFDQGTLGCTGPASGSLGVRSRRLANRAPQLTVYRAMPTASAAASMSVR